MDINLMVVSVGNSRLSVGVFLAGQLEYVNRMSLSQQPDWAGMISQAWKRLEETESPSIAGASVNPRMLEQVEHAIHQGTGQNVLWVGRELPLPIPVKTKQPEKTGIDRVLNIAAAYEVLGQACAVVDAGTAITVDFCDESGNFIGGAIAPGANLMLQALHEHTAALPQVTFAKPAGEIGDDTEQAMLHGVYHGLRGMVKELIETYALRLGTWPEVVATGGDAQALFGGWEVIQRISPDLQLYGIAKAFTDQDLGQPE